MIEIAKQAVIKAINDQYTRDYLLSCLEDERIKKNLSFSESEMKKLFEFVTASTNKTTLYRESILRLIFEKINFYREWPIIQ